MILLKDLFKNDDCIGFYVDKEDSLEFINYLYFNNFFVNEKLTYKQIVSNYKNLYKKAIILHSDGTIWRVSNFIVAIYLSMIKRYKYSDIKKGIINNLGEQNEKH